MTKKNPKTQYEKWCKDNNRFYCLTFFTKPTHDLPSDIRYAIYGKETCPETGRIHWQSYIECTKPIRFAGIKKRYKDKTIHIENKYFYSSREEAREYCKKDGNWKEFGEWIPGQGYRSDLVDIVEKLKNGTKLKELMLEEPEVYCRYRNGLKDIAAAVNEQSIPKWRDVEVILLTGPTGCGKTRKAMESDPYKIEGDNLEWWQDYNGENTILIDEYNNDLHVTKLLTLLDGYKLRLNVKGSHTYANWTKVYITTNLKIDELHSNAKQAHRDALFRRITKIENLW